MCTVVAARASPVLAQPLITGACAFCFVFSAEGRFNEYLGMAARDLLSEGVQVGAAACPARGRLPSACLLPSEVN